MKKDIKYWEQFLGYEVTDKVSLVKGVVMGVVTWITGCIQFSVQPRRPNGIYIPKYKWIDVNRVIVGDKVLDPSEVQSKK